MNILEAYGTRISAVLLDLEMPVMNGYDVLRAIKDHSIYEKILVLVITVHNKSELQVLEDGAADIITKPFDPMVVQKRVDNAIKNAQK